MKLVRTFVLVAAASAAPALAQDSPAGPGSADPPAGPAAPVDPTDPAKTPEAPKPAEPAKKERTADPKAVEACERYSGLLWVLQRTGAKEFTCRGELPIAQFGGEAIQVRPHWNAKSGLEVEYELPEALAAMVPPERLDAAKAQIKGQLKPLVQPYLDDFMADLPKYSLACKEGDGGTVVTMTAFASDTPDERKVVHFGKDGLIQRLVVTPRIDPNDPSAAMMAGMDLEIAVQHEKRGEKHVLTGYTLTLPMGEIKIAGSYYDGPAGTPIPKAIEISNPMTPEPQVLTFYDWTIDGKAVEGTAKPKPEPKKPETAAPAPAGPAPADPAVPSDPAKEPGKSDSPAPAGPEQGPGK